MKDSIQKVPDQSQLSAFHDIHGVIGKEVLRPGEQQYKQSKASNEE